MTGDSYMVTPSAVALLRRPRVSDLTGKSRTKIYNDIAAGLFIRGVALGGGRVAWPLHEVEAINRARIAGATDDDIRELVAQLHAARTGEGAI
ncbi:helix-turn-helix transcriptional regulator [Methylococcus mesophilus]|uniref:helix-turn-helix transcriptional regulator n=1 Tax=Methylococcus mesophilus TaxID=2993564 RepID=UPI00224B6151|nr:AlpA family phage regulatory protein [Methylococcus mesophilus]UZR29464.1 AlpA family phage regulatory protein [Methylococcus mesophilus]